MVLTSALFAQQLATNTGAINGRVTDSSGGAIPNVKVSLVGPDITQVFTTNAQGNYRFPSIPIGLYNLTFEATGFARLQRNQINIPLGFTATINVTLTPSAQQQTITVTGESPLVDTQSETVQGGFNLEQLNTVPNQRDMWSIIGLTPGMNDTLLDVGGSQVGNQVSYTSYGYGGQNRVMIDGINDSEGTNGAGFYFDYGTFQEFTVGTASNDASMPVPGNQVNAVIKSGTNGWHGDVYFDYENPDFQGHNISQAQLMQNVGYGQRLHTYFDPDGDFSGPIIKDKLWFYIGLRDQTVAFGVVGAPIQAPGTVPSYSYDRNVTEKVTYNINPNQRLSHFIQWNPIQKPQRGLAAGDYEDAMYYQKAEAWVGNVQWNSVWSPKFFTNMLVGTWGYNFPQVPYGVFPGDPGTSTCPCAQTLPRIPIGQLAPRMEDLASGDIAGGGASNTAGEVRLDPRRYQIEPTGSYFLDHFLHTSHQIRFGYLYEREIENDQYYAPPGGVFEIFDSKTSTGQVLPDFSTPFEAEITNEPRIQVSEILHHGLYLTDQFKVGPRVTINAGVRWDYYSSGYRNANLRSDCEFCGYFYEGQPLPNGDTLPASQNLVSGGFPNRTVNTFPHDIAPRIGIAYDLTGKGKTLLKLSYGSFYSYPSTTIAEALNPVQSATATFQWINPSNAAFNFSQLGPIVGSPSIATNAIVAPNLKDERFDDMDVIIQHQVSSTLSIEGGFIFRELHHAWEYINASLPASLFTLPVQETVPATWNAQGVAQSTNTITLWDVPKSAIPPAQTEIASPNGNNAIYRNLEFTINKRLSRRFTTVASVYWTHTTQNCGGYGETSNSTGNNGCVTSGGTPELGVPTNPDQSFNSGQSFSQWTAHVDGMYQAPWGIEISPVLRMQQGLPLNEAYPITNLNIGTIYIPLSPYATYRDPNMYDFDLGFQKTFTFHERYRLSAFFDLYNVFNANMAQSETSVLGTRSATVNVVGNPLFGQTFQYEAFQSPTGILPPRIFKIGARFSF
ncbi:MAG TPA: TonB-dependent receptor [Bryobacteraceae bacterium]|nr:TonB-dependent receptor [Bryobacteraceae bacterium]